MDNETRSMMELLNDRMKCYTTVLEGIEKSKIKSHAYSSQNRLILQAYAFEIADLLTTLSRRYEFDTDSELDFCLREVIDDQNDIETYIEDLVERGCLKEKEFRSISIIRYRMDIDEDFKKEYDFLNRVKSGLNEIMKAARQSGDIDTELLDGEK